MKEAVLCLGTNLGDREANLRQAVTALERLPHTTIRRVSSVYRTAPVEVTDEQPDYYNQCIHLSTDFSPHALLGICLGIEAAMGRKRVSWHGARVMDIDLLLYEGETCQSEELNLPHPGIRERAFVLVPLQEILPEKRFFSFSFEIEFCTIDKSSVHVI